MKKQIFYSLIWADKFHMAKTLKEREGHIVTVLGRDYGLYKDINSEGVETYDIIELSSGLSVGNSCKTIAECKTFIEDSTRAIRNRLDDMKVKKLKEEYVELLKQNNKSNANMTKSKLL